MKASELRIGNWVKGIESDCLFDVGEFKIDSFDIYKIDRYPKNISPIPLTEEWLLKFGLKKCGWYWENENIEIVEDDEGCWQLSINFNEFVEGEPFKHVHQLQNLYFALTGKELEV